MVVTVNLSGFEFTTLTGGISYNLWDTKFVHFLLGQNLRNERFLAGPLSISMFFYCIGQAYMDGLLEKYPDLPYLEKILAVGHIANYQTSPSSRSCSSG